MASGSGSGVGNINAPEGGNAATRVLRKNAPGNKSDPGWKHGFIIDGNNRKLKCKYCCKMSDNKAMIGLQWAPKVTPLLNGTKCKPQESSNQIKASVWIPGHELIDGLYVPPTDPRKLNKLLKKNVKDTAGSRWFDMPAPTITPELKKDLEVLKLRNFIDPKQHFKRGDKSKSLPKYFQVGTIIEPASEFFSARLKKKERKTTIAEELLSSNTFNDYRKRKVQEIQETRRPGGVEKWKNKGHQTWKRAKQKRK